MGPILDDQDGLPTYIQQRRFTEFHGAAPMTFEGVSPPASGFLQRYFKDLPVRRKQSADRLRQNVLPSVFALESGHKDDASSLGSRQTSMIRLRIMLMSGASPVSEWRAFN